MARSGQSDSHEAQSWSRMRAMRNLSIVCALVCLAAAGCEKEEAEKKTSAAEAAAAAKQAKKNAGVKPKDPVAPIKPAAKRAPAPTKPTASVDGPRAPTANDLATYTKGLGTGTLMATIETSEGTLNCELFEKDAPMTVANFVGLARGLHAFRDSKTREVVKRPFYDGLTFHRLIPGFMIQGGDPQGTGTGGPGYQFDQEIKPNLKHDRPGILSMANSGPNTNGSQFFVMDAAKTHLDGGYNVFGVCKEADIVRKIVSLEKRGSTPVKAPTMNKVTISRAKK